MTDRQPTVYITSDGTEYDDQQKAETHEQVTTLLNDTMVHEGCNIVTLSPEDVAWYVVEHYTLTRKEP